MFSSDLHGVGRVRKSRVQTAPFAVLKAHDVPSILVETAYISNPQDERLLDSGSYQEKLAQAMLAGIRAYFYRNPPRGTLIAQRVEAGETARAGVCRPPRRHPQRNRAALQRSPRGTDPRQ